MKERLLTKLKSSNSNVHYLEAYDGAERYAFLQLVKEGLLEEHQDVVSPEDHLIWRGKGFVPDRLYCHITGNIYDFKDVRVFKNYRLAS